MGNSLGAKKRAKVMKINGETLKLKTPVQAGVVVKDYPGHVLLESEAVKHFGIRAKALEAHQELEPKRLYFLVELPNVPKEKVPRRVRSGINMSAKDRLESLMLSRRSVSDLSLLKPTSMLGEEYYDKEGSQNGGAMRVKMKLPRAEVEKLMKESKDKAEVAEKIMDLCRANTGNNNGGHEIARKGMALDQQMPWKGDHGRVKEGVKGREVCFPWSTHHSIFICHVHWVNLTFWLCFLLIY